MLFRRSMVYCPTTGRKERFSMRIETERLIITDFTLDMVEAVHLNSLDEDNRRFVPDEVFETMEEARETVEFLMGRYGSEEGPFVHPVLLKTGDQRQVGGDVSGGAAACQDDLLHRRGLLYTFFH